MQRVALIVAAILLGGAAPETGLWLTQDHVSVIAISECGSGICGRVVGITLDHPGDPPPVDVWGRRQCQEAMIDMQHRGADGRWHGTIMDPRSGHRWNAQIWRVGDVLRLRGYIGLPLFGATQDWTRYGAQPAPDCRFTP